MKLQIDTDNKTITIEEDILFKTLINTLDNMFPNGTWESFTLRMQVINNWNNPIVYPIIYHTIYPQYLEYPWITYYDNTNSPTVNYGTGIYNVNLD